VQGSAKRNAAWRGLERSDDTGPRGPCAALRPAQDLPRLTPAQRDGEDGVHQEPTPSARRTGLRVATTICAELRIGVAFPHEEDEASCYQRPERSGAALFEANLEAPGKQTDSDRRRPRGAGVMARDAPALGRAIEAEGARQAPAWLAAQPESASRPCRATRSLWAHVDRIPTSDSLHPIVMSAK